MTTTPESSAEARRRRAVEAALDALDLTEKVSLLACRDARSLPAIERIGLRPLVLADGPEAVRGPSGPEPLFPSPSGQAATWDAGLVRRIGRAVGRAARERGVHLLLGPSLNLQRSPLGGRHGAAYSEDPRLTAETGAAFVAGVQDAGVAAAPGRYVAHESETGGPARDVHLDEKVLRELYLAPFEAAVRQARAWALRTSGHRVLGAAMAGNVRLQHGVLKGEWEFDGAVVSDWGACRDTERAAMGGTDIAVPSGAHAFGAALVAAVRAGRVPESAVDGQVRRVLLLAARTGLLAGAEPAVPQELLPAVRDASALAREAAVRSFVLLRNAPVERGGEGPARPVLPLDAAGLGRVAVIGQAAGAAGAPLEGLRAALPEGVELVHEPGPRPAAPPVAGGPRWRGLRAVFRGPRGKELHRTGLDAAALPHATAWPDEVPVERLRQVEIRGEFTPDASGPHVFSGHGPGPLRMVVDGVEVSAGPVCDGPQEVRSVRELRAGVPVRVTLARRADGGAEVLGPLRLGLAAPEPEPGPDDEELISRAAFAAAFADAAVVVVGGAADDGTGAGPGDRAGLDLPGRQDDLVERVLDANPNTVVVVAAGAPVHLPWRERAAAVLLAWLPGREFGPALADVLLGAEEPGGRLPTTWPARQEDCPVLAVRPDAGGVLGYDEGLFTGYPAWERRPPGTPPPAYWFGHGLGYTDWTYERVRVSPSAAPDSAGVATVTLVNSGPRRGREVVQLYAVSECAECIESDRPARRLAAFAVVEAGPGQRVEVSLPVPLRAVRGWDRRRGGWHRLPGRHRVEAGRSVADLRVRALLDDA